MDSHPQSKHPRPRAAAVGLLLATALCCSAGCATSWPVVGQLKTPPPEYNAAGKVTLSDSSVRVLANSAGDVVPVDVPAAIAGTAQLKDSATAATARQNSAHGVAASEPKRRRGAESGQVFRRLEAALDGSDSNPSPPPPPIARSIRPVVMSPRAVTGPTGPIGPIEPAGLSDSLIPPPTGTIPEITIEATSSTISPTSSTSPTFSTFSKRPRDLDPAPAVAVVVRLPDVTDWSVNEAQGSLAAIAGETATTSGSAAVLTRTAPWWITLIGLVAMVGLIGLSRRFGWPSVSPLE